MTAQFTLCLVAVVLTSVSFSGAMRFYFRQSGVGSRWQMLMKLLVVAASIVLYVAIWDSRDVDSPMRWAGLAAVALAQVVFWATVRAHGSEPPTIAFGDSRTSRLVSWGPYRWVRHPFYTAYILAWAGPALIAVEPALLFFAVLMGGVYAVAARREEEEILDGPLGAEYRELMRTTGRFWPRLLGA